jgi:uncharacterized protein YegL
MELKLNNLDIELLLDKSASMGISDCKGKPRWKAMQEQTEAWARDAEKVDSDGITVVPFARDFKVHEGVTANKVHQIFTEHSPGGSTDTALVLKSRLDAYFARKAKATPDAPVKSVCLIVITDGEPDDRDAVAAIIVDASKKMDADEEIAIQFIQIGQDGAAEAFLKYLDDNLTAQGAKFDIVDTNKMEAVEGMPFQDLLAKSFAD